MTWGKKNEYVFRHRRQWTCQLLKITLYKNTVADDDDDNDDNSGEMHYIRLNAVRSAEQIRREFNEYGREDTEFQNSYVNDAK